MTWCCSHPAWQWTSTLPSGASLMDKLGWRSSWAGQHAVHAQPACFPPRLWAIILALANDRLPLRRRPDRSHCIRVEMGGLKSLHFIQGVDDPSTEFEKAWPTSLPTPLLERPRRQAPSVG